MFAAFDVAINGAPCLFRKEKDVWITKWRLLYLFDFTHS